MAKKSNVVPIKKEPMRRAWLMVNHDPADIVKIQKRLGTPAVDELEVMTQAERRAYLAILANHEEQTRVAKKKDIDVLGAREKLRIAESTYKETLKGIADRRSLTVHYLETR